MHPYFLGDDNLATLLQAHAASAKAGVDTLIRHVALEYGPYGIRANTIARKLVSHTLFSLPSVPSIVYETNANILCDCNACSWSNRRNRRI